MVQVELTKRAKKDLEKLDSKIKERIKQELRALARGKTYGVPLSGEFKGLFKLRVGDYRIIFKRITKDYFLIRYIRHRREVYRR